MAEEQNLPDNVPDERGIAPVAGGRSNAQRTLLMRGAGATAMVAFAALVLWGTWRSDRKADVARPERVVVRQTAQFEAARESTPAPPPSQLVQPMAMPTTPAALPMVQPATRSAEDQLLDSARRAPVLIYNRPTRLGPPGRDVELSAYAATPLPNGAVPGGQSEPRNELADKLKPTPIEGVRAARLPN